MENWGDLCRSSVVQAIMYNEKDFVDTSEGDLKPMKIFFTILSYLIFT